jgi:hypothetical protein
MLALLANFRLGCTGWVSKEITAAKKFYCAEIGFAGKANYDELKKRNGERKKLIQIFYFADEARPASYSHHFIFFLNLQTLPISVCHYFSIVLCDSLAYWALS